MHYVRRELQQRLDGLADGGLQENIAIRQSIPSCPSPRHTDAMHPKAKRPAAIYVLEITGEVHHSKATPSYRHWRICPGNQVASGQPLRCDEVT